MNLLENFEYSMYYRVIEYVTTHRQDDARTGLLLFLTDEIRNMVRYNEVNTPIDSNLPEWISVDRDLFNGLYRLEYALRVIPDLANDYIRGNYSNENKGFVKTMLDICESDIFPAFSVLNNFNVPEVQEINNIIDQLHQYNKWFEAYDIINIDDLMDRLYTTTFNCIKSVLDTIGFGKIAIIYKEILTHTGKERNYYVTDSPIILLNNAVNSVMTNLKDPDKERVDAIKKIFREFITGEVDTQKLSDIYKSLVQQPTLSGILAYESLIRPFGVIMHADPDYDYKLERAVTTLGNIVSLIDYQGQPDIVKRLDDAMAIEDKNERIDKILEIYDDIASRFKEMDFRVIVELILAFYYNLLISSQYIPIVPSITEADDVRRVPVIDRQGVLKAIATYDIHDIEIMPLLPKGDNAYNQVEQYLITFLGDYGIYASDQIFMRKIDNFIDRGVQSDLSYQKSYAEDYDEIPLFASVEDKILANMPEEATNAEVAFLQAASLAWNNSETTDEEREVIERLLPPHTYMDFVNSAAQQGKNDIVCSSLKQLTPEELCVLCPDRWDNPNAVTNEDIGNYMQELVNYIDKNAATMSFESYVLTGGMDDQYILLGLVKAYTQQLNKVFEGHGKFTVLSIPTAKANTEGLDIAVPFVMRNNNDTVTMGVYYIDSKSTTNANTKNGSALSNITQCACTLFAIKESEIKQIKYKLLDIGDDLDELLPRLIDKHNTPVLSQMSHQDNKKLIISLLTYFSTLYTYTMESLNTDSLAPDNPHKAEEAMGYQYGGLFNIISSIAGNNTAQAKFIVGEVFKEATYIIRELCKDIDSVIDVEMSAPVYITFKSFVDSLIPATKKELQKVQLAVIERSDYEK